jgi:RNA polymerase sigma factor (sigma-70 family)
MNTTADDRRALESLLSRIGAHDQLAFRELYELTSPRLFGVCLRMLRNRAEAEEVSQEVFVTVWRRAGEFDPRRATATTWLVTLARNKSIDRLRQRRDGAPLTPIDLDQLADPGQGPPADAELTEDRRRLQKCLEGLEPKDRDSVREAFFSGATYKELAERCRVPLGTMKSWIRRALLQLRACLET